MLPTDRRSPRHPGVADRFHSDRHFIGLKLTLLLAITVIVLALEVPPAGWTP